MMWSEKMSPENSAVWWIVANAAGWAVTMSVFEALPDYLKPIACVIIGTAQWLALRNQWRMSAWWMAATSLAWFGGLWAGAAHSFVTPDPYWAGGVGGALAGISQCWILWGRTSHPVLWVPVSIIASAAGWWLGVVVGIEVNSQLTEHWSYIVGGASGGMLIGLLSAPSLIWMMRHPKSPAAVHAVVEGS